MIEIKANKDCVGCGACAQACPKGCISMREDSEGFLYPKVDIGACVDCHLCERVCPVINQGQEKEPLRVLAAYNPNEEMRLKSSSGGIFTMLAERTIEEGGVVFGAKFDDNWQVVHSWADTKAGLEAFRGSKYVQSVIGDAFKQCRAFLVQGRNVLFSGTPCQIAALRRFLGKEYENLLTVDLICHGAPSPGVWREYLEEIMPRPTGVAAGKNMVPQSRNDVSVVAGISFRDKRNGWGKYGFSIRYAARKGGENTVFQSVEVNSEADGEEYYESMPENAFMQGFLSNLYLRPSCYDCPAKCLKSGADITLGDYWGITSILPELNDDKGISVVMVNSAKGSKMFDSLGIAATEAPYAHVCLNNSALVESPHMPINRDKFFSDRKRPLKDKVKRLTATPFMLRALRFCKRVAKRVLRIK